MPILQERVRPDQMMEDGKPVSLGNHPIFIICMMCISLIYRLCVPTRQCIYINLRVLLLFFTCYGVVLNPEFITLGDNLFFESCSNYMVSI